MLAKNVKDMPIIELTWDEYHHIFENERFDRGGESIICNSGKPDTLYKFFKHYYSERAIDMPDNKVRKIIALHVMNPEYMVKPLSLVSAGRYIVGYEMTYNPNSVTLYDSGFKKSEKIEVLEQAQEALQYFASLDITYGDVKSNNILVDYDTGEISFCDIDNIRIGEYPIDLEVGYLKHFISKYGKIDGVADAYMHNILTLQQLGFPNSHPTYSNVVRTIEAGIYPKGFRQEARPIFESMANPKEFNGEYAIQYIKK